MWGIGGKSVVIESSRTFACWEPEYLCFRVLRWERKMIPARETAGERISFRDTTGYVSEDEDTNLEKSSRRGEYAVLFRHRWVKMRVDQSGGLVTRGIKVLPQYVAQ